MDVAVQDYVRIDNAIFIEHATLADVGVGIDLAPWPYNGPILNHSVCAD
jgi:hypothetical protein